MRECIGHSMALSFSVASLPPTQSAALPSLRPKQKHFPGLCCLPPLGRADAQSGATVPEEDSLSPPLSGPLSSSRTQLDLLEQLTSSSSSIEGSETVGSPQRPAIRDQLSLLVGNRDDDFILPLGKDLKKVTDKFLTISQKRNIRRQAYLDVVSQRNDTVFFATIGVFVVLPPFVILGIAIITGFVQPLP